MKRKLDISNVPTENEYNRLLEYLKTKLNKDYYFFIKVLGTTGARLSEFQQFTWEDIAIGEVVLKGKETSIGVSFSEAITTGGEGLYKGDRQVRYSCCREIRTVDSEVFHNT